MTQHLLLIEDDERLGALVVEYLTEAGFRMSHALTGADGLARLEAASDAPIDGVVLDLMLPDMDGLKVCQKIRAHSNTPILMLTARGDAMDRIVGLEMGADDYLPKPFEPRELLARLRAILRRGGSGGNSIDSAHPDTLSFGRLIIDQAAREVRLAGQLCDITSYQYDLLLTLAERAGRVLSRDFLIEQLKNQTLEAFDRSIDVHISRLRAVIEDDAKSPKRIVTVRGAGYVFAKQQD